jgi:hypothetical protein
MGRKEAKAGMPIGSPEDAPPGAPADVEEDFARGRFPFADARQRADPSVRGVQSATETVGVTGPVRLRTC